MDKLAEYLAAGFKYEDARAMSEAEKDADDSQQIWVVDEVTEDHKTSIERDVAGPLTYKNAERFVEKLRGLTPYKHYNIRDGRKQQKEVELEEVIQNIKERLVIEKAQAVCTETRSALDRVWDVIGG